MYLPSFHFPSTVSCSFYNINFLQSFHVPSMISSLLHHQHILPSSFKISSIIQSSSSTTTESIPHHSISPPSSNHFPINSSPHDSRFPPPFHIPTSSPLGPPPPRFNLRPGTAGCVSRDQTWTVQPLDLRVDLGIMPCIRRAPILQVLIVR